MKILYRRSCRTAMLVTVLGTMAGTVLADESPKGYLADEIVVTATRTPNPVSKLPMAVEVITHERIEESGAQTLSDVLEEAQDVNALEPGNGRLGVARLRGLDSRLTLLLIDGMRVTSGFQGYTDLHEIPAGIIERIEIVRGSGSALYGSDAIGGVINVITRKPTSRMQGGFDLSGGGSKYGQASTVETNAWLTGTTGRLGYAVAGSFYDRDRYDRHPADLLTDGDDRVIGSGTLALSYALKPGVKFTGGLIYADNSLDGLRTNTSGDLNRSVDSDRLTGYLGAEIKTGDDALLTLRLSRTTYDWSSFMDNYLGLPRVTTTLSGGNTKTTRTWTTTWSSVSQDADQIEARWTGKLTDTHRLTAGMEYRTEDRVDYSRVLTKTETTTTNPSGDIVSGPTTSTPPAVVSRIENDAHNLGLFLQDEIRVFDPLSVIAGIRYDYHSDFGSEISPKVAALLRIDDHLKLRASFGQGFRAPSLYELYTGTTTTKQKVIYANPDLKAETSRSYEVGADFAWKGVTSGVTAFRNELKNMISEVLIDGTVTPMVYRYENLTRAMTRGIEISTSLRLPYGLRLSDRISFLDTKNEDTGQELLFNPGFTNIVRLDFVNIRYGLKGNVRVVSIGSQQTATDRIGGYSLVNCYLAKQVAKGTELYAGADNLFNYSADATVYGNTEGAGLMGTYLYGGVHYKF